jgi:hypothetical protein
VIKGLKIVEQNGIVRELGDDELEDMKVAVKANTDAQNDAPFDDAGDGWKGSIFGACPLQGEGEVDGHAWYFKARRQSWTFEVRDHRVAAGKDWQTGGNYGEGPYDAGWMKHSHAWVLIRESIARFRRGKP